jgi:inner membrane transporter RhtA
MVMPSRAIERPPALGLVVAGAVSVQFGAAIATKLFAHVGPVGAVTLRLVFASAVLVVGRTLSGAMGPARRRDWAVAVAFGVVLAAMNLSFYEAIDRIPLGVAVTIEFSGPLALAVAGSRRWTDGMWAAAAGAGVALLATGVGRHLDPVGVGLALLAGLFWAFYILLSKETGRRLQALDGLVVAMTAAGLLLLPFGLVSGGSAMFRPSVLAVGLGVAVLSSVIPYSLELLALRRVSSRAFGVMMSLDPALATAAGFIVLGQRLTAREWAALALVVGANLGNSFSSRSRTGAAIPSSA